MDSDVFEVIDATHLNDKIDRVVYRRRSEFTQPPPTNSVPITVFVTSHARRRLFDYITEAVRRGLKLVYTDTDSLAVKRHLSQAGIDEGGEWVSYEYFFK